MSGAPRRDDNPSALALGAEGQRGQATAIGSVAVLLWSFLALLTTWAGPVPPFLLVALTFGTAFLCAIGLWTLRGESIRSQFRWPWRVWALGVGGLFGYHLLYFIALSAAPPVEANLVNYLWPLLLILRGDPGHRRRPRRVPRVACRRARRGSRWSRSASGRSGSPSSSGTMA